MSLSIADVAALSLEEVARLRSDVCFFAERVLGWTAHAAQRSFLECRAKVRVGCFGRQSGKSSMMNVCLLHTALYHRDSNQFVVAGTYKNASIIFNMMRKTIADSEILREKVVRVVRTPNPMIVFDNGSKIQFFTVANEGEHIRGETCHRIVVDEAAFLPDDVVDTVLMPMLVRFDGELVLISTPYGRNYFYRYYNLGLNDSSGRVKSFHFTSYDNPFLPAKELDYIKSSTPDLVWRQEYMAEFLDDSAFVFPGRIIEPCLVDEDIVKVAQKGHWYVMGVDIARLKDFTAIVVLDISEENAIRVAWFERFNEPTMAVQDENKYWEACKERIVEVAEVFQPQRVIVDSSSAGNPVFEWIKPLVPQAEAYTFANSKSNPKKQLLVNQCVLGFQQKRVRLPDCDGTAALLEELRFFAYKLTDDNNMQMMAASGHHDDTVMALCLAWSAVSAPQGDVGVASFERKSKPLNTSGAGDVIVLGVNPAGDVRSTGVQNPFDSDDNFGAWRTW